MDQSSRPTFSFVNLKHPDDLKDAETQLRIRRLAMTKVSKARRKPKTKRGRNEIVLELRKTTHKQSGIDRLGSGPIDPFGRYPIELDDDARALLANIFSTGNAHASQLRGSWFPVALDSAAAFHNVLANSQNFIFQKMYGFFPSQDNALALTHHHKALRLAREVLSDLSKHTSNDAMRMIVSFTCHHALLGSFAGGEWKQHQDALLRIIGLRGGYDTIDQDHLRTTVSWGDLMGSFAQDIPPSVPLPCKWEADSRSPRRSLRPHSPITLAWKQQLPRRLDWVSIFDDVVHLISLDRVFNEQQLELATTSGSWVEPTMYRLLAIRPMQLGNDREHVLEEVCRLGTLLFLAPFWRILGQSPVWTAVISRNLQLVLLQYKTEWNELKPLLIWTLYCAAVESSDLVERSQFVFMLAMAMGGMQFQEWSEILEVVKGVLWVDKVFAGTDELIRDEVMQISPSTQTLIFQLRATIIGHLLVDHFVKTTQSTARTHRDVYAGIDLSQAALYQRGKVVIIFDDPASATALFKKVKQKYGHANVLVNHAPIFKVDQRAKEVNQQCWWNEMTINIRRTFLATQQFLKLCPSPDTPAETITVTTGAAYQVFLALRAYGMSKLAVLELMTYVTVKNLNVVATALHLVVVDTEMTKDI